MDYLLAAGIVIAMTITPLPLPPSWLVLAYLSVRLDANPVAIVVAGALGAAIGRSGLALWTRALGPRLLRPAARENVDYLADRLRGRRSTIGVATVLAVSPPPSGALYTAAGLLRTNLAVVAGACFVGRLVTYGLGVGVAGAATGDLADRIRAGLGPWSIAGGIALLVAFLWVLGRLDWSALLESRRLRLRSRPASPSQG